MSKHTRIIIILLGLIVLSCLPLFKDPYYHRERINFWQWAHREIVETLTHERE